VCVCVVEGEVEVCNQGCTHAHTQHKPLPCDSKTQAMEYMSV